MVYKYELANQLASFKVIEISQMPENKKTEHYKTMSYEDWCKYYFKLPKKFLKSKLNKIRGKI